MTPEAIATYVTFAALAIIGAIQNDSRQKEKQREKDAAALAKRQEQSEADIRAQSERLRLDELATEQLKGRVALVEQAQTHATGSMSEVRDQMVHRREFETFANNLDGQLRDLAKLVRDNLPDRRRASSESDPRQPAIRP